MHERCSCDPCHFKINLYICRSSNTYLKLCVEVQILLMRKYTFNTAVHWDWLRLVTTSVATQRCDRDITTWRPECFEHHRQQTLGPRTAEDFSTAGELRTRTKALSIRAQVSFFQLTAMQQVASFNIIIIVLY